MRQQAIWKLSMGRGDFDDILDVLDYLRQGLVIAHKNTRKLAFVQESQGDLFVHPDRDGDYFYLCHSNRTAAHPRRGIVLLGQFTGPPIPVRHHKWTDTDGWMGRPFRWVKTAISSKKLHRDHRKQWTPRNNSTFVEVPTKDADLFESLILEPYFGLTFTELKLHRYT